MINEYTFSLSWSGAEGSGGYPSNTAHEAGKRNAAHRRAPYPHTITHLGAIWLGQSPYRHVFGKWKETREPKEILIYKRRTCTETTLKSEFRIKPWSCEAATEP